MGKIACVRQTKRILELIEIDTVEEITVGVCCCVGLVAQTTLILIRLSGQCVCAIAPGSTNLSYCSCLLTVSVFAWRASLSIEVKLLCISSAVNEKKRL